MPIEQGLWQKGEQGKEKEGWKGEMGV